MKRLALHGTLEEFILERVEPTGDVVVPVEVAIIEDVREDLLRQDMLDQHLPDVGITDRRVDRLPRMIEELCCFGSEALVGLVSVSDFFPQRLKDGRHVALELFHRFPEVGDLLPLVSEKEVEKAEQLRAVGDATAQNLVPVLDQDGFARVLEDDVVLRVAAPELFRDLHVEIVVLILRLPVAERHPEIVKDVPSGRIWVFWLEGNWYCATNWRFFCLDQAFSRSLNASLMTPSVVVPENFLRRSISLK